MYDILKSALRNIRRKKIRSLLTVLGITIGVMSVIVIGNISECGSTAIKNEMENFGIGGITISTNTMIGDAELTEQDLETIRQENYVQQAMPLVVQSTKISCKGNQQDAIVWGVDSKSNQIISMEPVYGRIINKGDLSALNNVCMIDEKFAKSHYKRENILGKKISVFCLGNFEDFEVIGIIKTNSSLLNNLMGEYIPNFVYVPYTTLQSLNNTQNFSQITVKIANNQNPDSVGEHIVSKLSELNGQSKYVSNNVAKQKDSLLNMLNIITLVLSAVGAISLLVANLSIMTVMLVSVNERTKEIGIKKSIGAKRQTIMTEFLLEAVYLSLIGCIVGITTGLIFSFLGAHVVNMKLNLRWDIIFTAMFFSVFSGIIFGVYPAAKASKLRPVDAFRTE